jgi:hypothetical protein
MEIGNIIKVQESYLEVTGINLMEYGIIEAVPLNFPDHKEMRIQLASVELVWELKPQSENGKLPIPHVSDSLPEPTMQELEDMIDYINTQVVADQLDDFMDKAGKLNNFVKKYQRQ